MVAELSSTGPPLAGSDSEGQPRPIVFFDGVCGLCNRSVDLLLQIDRRDRLRFAPLQGETAADRLDSAARDLRTIVVVDERGMARKSSAVVRILFHLGGRWMLLGVMLWMIPRPLRNWGYDFIAHYRYRWFGKTEACRMPRPGEMDKFLP